MKQEFTIMQAAFNVIDAAELNHKHLQDLIRKVDSASSLLKTQTEAIEGTVASAISQSVNQSAHAISKIIMHDLSKANALATEAAEALTEASKKSFRVLLTTQLLFLALSVFVLWFFFMKDIPTREEFLELRNASEQLQSYGYVYNCGTKKCVEIEGLSSYSVEGSPAKLYTLKPRQH